ncbi:MAG: CpsB/CapC family capsule biosynthesis tyrosine phosphatase [Bryobacteraceae bacterium]
MIDIHSHIVWGVDDGAPGMEESIAMLEAAGESGTTEIVATPHANAQYAYEPELVEDRIRELAAKTGGKPKIHRGCEFHLNFDNVDHLLEQPFRYTINGKQYLLIECPDFHVGRHTDTVLRRLVDAGLTPIVAHPERNPVVRREVERLERWVELGCLTQVTALSIVGGFGGSAKAASMRLLRRGLVHIVASDTHDPVCRHPRLDEAYRIVRSRCDEDTAEILFTDNPRAVVDGHSLAGGKMCPWQPETQWYQFWK